MTNIQVLPFPILPSQACWMSRHEQKQKSRLGETKVAKVTGALQQGKSATLAGRRLVVPVDRGRVLTWWLSARQQEVFLPLPAGVQAISWGLYLFVSIFVVFFRPPQLPLWRKQTHKLLLSPELRSQAPGGPAGFAFIINIKLENSRSGRKNCSVVPC